ncbi:NAD(P)/FAD-dependent oxidoreductase [Williamsia herbipolensis]|uniref:NAD(P)/FAD-dependent oxidoreductase n=1 Tax=Williamsia herbipolensis TaxID=1603258 RepID=UPI0005F810DF|nr:NAD(P)-binding protein [Williamsia herbipolensis]
MSTEHTVGTPVTVVGAGMAGAACAAALVAAGVPVRVLDRGRAPGGRMASPELHGRRVDVGAGYFTVRDNGFQAVVGEWRGRGLAREWTDTFGVLAADAPPSTSTGPMRWATPGGLRSLVRDVLGDIEVTTADLDALPDGDVVIAMPDPQAARLTEIDESVGYDPVIAVAVGFEPESMRDLPFTHAAFVNDHPSVSFIADDGSRRGDGAAVLVAHTTPDLAAAHLDDPAEVIGEVEDAVTELLGIGRSAIEWTHAHRWTFAKPTGAHDATHSLQQIDGRLVGLAGDQWCPEGSPRVESAWRSGTDLAAAIIARRDA